MKIREKGSQCLPPMDCAFPFALLNTCVMEPPSVFSSLSCASMALRMATCDVSSTIPPMTISFSKCCTCTPPTYTSVPLLHPSFNVLCQSWRSDPAHTHSQTACPGSQQTPTRHVTRGSHFLSFQPESNPEFPVHFPTSPRKTQSTTLRSVGKSALRHFHQSAYNINWSQSRKSGDKRIAEVGQSSHDNQTKNRWSQHALLTTNTLIQTHPNHTKTQFDPKTDRIKQRNNNNYIL